MRLTITLLLAALVALVSAVSYDEDYPGWNEGWNNEPDPSKPCTDGDCNVATTQVSKTTTRKSTTTKRATKTPKVTKTTAPPKPKSSHKDECTTQEKRKAGCLHGGVCFVIEFNKRAVYCQCPHMYKGKRCEEIDGDIYVISAGVKAAIGVSVGLIALLIIVIVVVVCIRRRKSKRNKERNKKEDKELTVSFENGRSKTEDAGKPLVGKDKDKADI